MNTDWRNYPFRLVHNDSALDFPAAEGEHADQESDTWFIAGELTATTGRSFAFLTIFNKNRPGGTVVADFYTMALFDCDTGAYGTYTDYDMPPKNMHPDAQPKLSMAAGHLDIHYESSAGTAAWTTCRDDHGELLPYTYRVSLFGVDQADQPMELDLTVTPTRAPVPVGAATLNGKIVCFGQHDTYSYFQTGMAMSGTLRSVVVFVGYNLFFGAVIARTDNAAHIGGLVMGLLLGALIAKVAPAPDDFLRRIAVLLVGALLVFGGVMWLQHSRSYLLHRQHRVVFLGPDGKQVQASPSQASPTDDSR